MRYLMIGCLLASASFGQSVGQSDRGMIAGTVKDPLGHPVANAPIQAKNTATGSVSKTVSDKAGKYTLADVPTGSYEISVPLQGVKSFEQKGVMVAAAKTLELN